MISSGDVNKSLRILNRSGVPRQAQLLTPERQCAQSTGILARIQSSTSSALLSRSTGALDEPFPENPLLLPVRDDRNCAHFAFAEAGDVVGGGFKVEDCFLDVRGKLGKVDNLRYASSGNASGTGDLGFLRF